MDYLQIHFSMMTCNLISDRIMRSRKIQKILPVTTPLESCCWAWSKFEPVSSSVTPYLNENGLGGPLNGSLPLLLMAGLAFEMPRKVSSRIKNCKYRFDKWICGKNWSRQFAKMILSICNYNQMNESWFNKI